MDTVTAISTRRAVKQFDPDFHLSGKDLNELLELTLLSPTAFNIQHWRFLVLKDPELRQAVQRVSSDQPQVTSASALVLICADINAWKKEPNRYWHDAPEGIGEFVVNALSRFYEGRAQLQRDEAMRSIGIAAQTLMLAATARGLDTCPMDLIDNEAVSQLIELPADHVLGMYVAIGKALEPAWPRAGQLATNEVVMTDRF